VTRRCGATAGRAWDVSPSVEALLVRRLNLEYGASAVFPCGHSRACPEPTSSRTGTTWPRRLFVGRANRLVAVGRTWSTALPPSSHAATAGRSPNRPAPAQERPGPGGCSSVEPIGPNRDNERCFRGTSICAGAWLFGLRAGFDRMGRRRKRRTPGFACLAASDTQPRSRQPVVPPPPPLPRDSAISVSRSRSRGRGETRPRFESTPIGAFPPGGKRLSWGSSVF
jgi:hypothetical protein